MGSLLPSPGPPPRAGAVGTPPLPRQGVAFSPAEFCRVMYLHCTSTQTPQFISLFKPSDLILTLVFLQADILCFIWNKSMAFPKLPAFPPRDCVLMGLPRLSRKLQTEHHRGATIHSVLLLPPVRHLSFFSPHGCQLAFSSPSSIRTPLVLWALAFLLYRLGLFTLVPSGTKCKRLSTRSKRGSSCHSNERGLTT